MAKKYFRLLKHLIVQSIDYPHYICINENSRMSFGSINNKMVTSFQYSSLPELQAKQNLNFITKCTIKILNSVRMSCLGRGQTYNPTSRRSDGPVVRQPGSPTIRQSDRLSPFISYSMKIKYMFFIRNIRCESKIRRQTGVERLLCGLYCIY